MTEALLEMSGGLAHNPLRRIIEPECACALTRSDRGAGSNGDERSCSWATFGNTSYESTYPMSLLRPHVPIPPTQRSGSCRSAAEA